VLTSRTNKPFESVELVVPIDAGIQIEATDFVPHRRIFRITQKVVAAESRSHTVRFQVRYAQDRPPADASLRVSYYGLPIRQEEGK
jgi:hypothetical protein